MNTESEKDKYSQRHKLALWRWLTLILGLIAMLIAIWACGFNLWFDAGSVKSNLDPEYIPTAEYLLENPYEEPSTSFDELNIEFGRFNVKTQEICFTIWGSSNADFDRANIVEVFINEELAARIKPDSFILTSLPAQKPFCISGTLDAGLHIIEVKAYSDIFTEPNYVHRWAIKVE